MKFHGYIACQRPTKSQLELHPKGRLNFKIVFGTFSMLRRSLSSEQIRELLLRILSISASLAGFCVAGIGLLNAQPKTQPFAGFGDDILALAAVLFLVCTYLTFWALRTSRDERLVMLAKLIDVLFLAGLTLVVISGVGIVYALF